MNSEMSYWTEWSTIQGVIARVIQNRTSAKREADLKRVSMGLTVSRKTAKNLAVRRKNERILTASRKKMLTVKNLTTK